MSNAADPHLLDSSVGQEIRVSKQDLRITRLVDVTRPALEGGAARLRLDVCSLTSNNVTYAAMGEAPAGYWDFFPASDGWGRPPVWGFATVVESTVPELEQGSRHFGFFPLSETLDVVPLKAGARGFIDGAPHRTAKVGFYNQYTDTRTDPAYDSDREAEQALLRPLYPSGWWTADRVRQDAPRAVVISSASSKTALATAHKLRSHGDAELVALTSARHADYVRGTGLYSRTVTYEQVSTIAARASVTYVDFLGSEAVNAAVHHALGSTLSVSLLLGATDWASKPGGVRAPSAVGQGPRPEALMIPLYAPKRLQVDRELGAAMVRDMRAFYAESGTFVTPLQLSGMKAASDCWAKLASGQAVPHQGFVLSF